MQKPGEPQMAQRLSVPRHLLLDCLQHVNEVVSQLDGLFGVACHVPVSYLGIQRIYYP